MSESDPTSPAPAPAEPALVARAYDVLLWLVKHVEKFPRTHRYTIGELVQAARLAANRRAERNLALTNASCRRRVRALRQPQLVHGVRGDEVGQASVF